MHNGNSPWDSWTEDERGFRQYGDVVAFHALRQVVADNEHLSQKDWRDAYQLLQERCNKVIWKRNHESI